jgi:hypothetical protein
MVSKLYTARFSSILLKMNFVKVKLICCMVVLRVSETQCSITFATKITLKHKHCKACIAFNKNSFRVATCRKILHDKPFVFVGQGPNKNTYKNALKANLYKAYGVLTKYSFRPTTSNKKYGFVMLRHARLALFHQPKLENPSKYI